ncbi:interleukin-21 isoform X1 [Pleuronectes platessa]|uniref:interleukin-21 isoform X1 n=1 Tax=Pleuronectes platessa TaxID=8262 RepID=UPI00232A4DD7|nr:interleukin-21 isoform X1 [Pleuronectes platessa]
MKLAVLFLVAVCCCCSLGFAGSKERNKLEEVREHLKNLRTTLLQNKGTMLHSPPHDVEDCCYRSALQCFHSNLVVHFKATSKTQTKFNRSLRHPLTISGVKHCPPPNNTVRGNVAGLFHYLSARRARSCESCRRGRAKLTSPPSPPIRQLSAPAVTYNLK